MLLTTPALRSMPLAVTARLLRGFTPPTAAPRTTLALVPLAEIVKARGVPTASLSTVAATVITALAPVALKLVLSPSVSAPV